MKRYSRAKTIAIMRSLSDDELNDIANLLRRLEGHIDGQIFLTSKKCIYETTTLYVFQNERNIILKVL